MFYKNYKIIVGFIFGVILTSGLVYFVVFGRALSQPENHLGILFALPKVIFGSEVVRIDDKKYLAKDANAFIQEMAKQGFGYTEQMGSGYFFRKDEKKYLTVGQMYSSYFMIFTSLVEN